MFEQVTQPTGGSDLVRGKMGQLLQRDFTAVRVKPIDPLKLVRDILHQTVPSGGDRSRQKISRVLVETHGLPLLSFRIV